MAAPPTVVGCAWGDDCGAKLRFGGRSIPGVLGNRAVGDDIDVDDVSMWALLDIDPYYELRLFAAEGGAGTESTPHAPPLAREVIRLVTGLPELPEVLSAAMDCGVADTLPSAVAEVLNASPFQEALASPGAEPTELAGAITRAVVATAIHLGDELDGGTRAIDGQRRDELVAQVSWALAADSRGTFGRWARAGGRLAFELGASRLLERRRAVITQAVGPVAGDVLLYLARGARIRRHIADCISGLNDDVVLLAHSLGGIATFDVLVKGHFPNVRCLITVGSQIALLHELDALPSLEPGTLPDSFPVPWLNVYDNRDLLSFLAAPIFGPGVQDVVVDSRTPFPRSHSAYFGSRDFYAIVAAAVKGGSS